MGYKVDAHTAQYRETITLLKAAALLDLVVVILKLLLFLFRQTWIFGSTTSQPFRRVLTGFTILLHQQPLRVFQ